MMKWSEKMKFLFYLAAMAVYAVYTAVRIGVVSLYGTLAELLSDLTSGQLSLSEYIFFRHEPELNSLYLLNLMRGVFILAVIYLLGWVIQTVAVERIAEKKESAPVQRRIVEEEYEEEEYEEDEEEDDDMKSGFAFDFFRDREKTAPQSRKPVSSEKNEKTAVFNPFEESASELQSVREEPRRQQNDFFSNLGEEADNVRVIVKITQYDEEQNKILSFFCGDTLKLERYSTKNLMTNSAVGNRDIRQYIKKKRKEQDVFYVFQIRESAQNPVVLCGDEEYAARLVEEKISLRIYREKMLFITRQDDIRTIQNESQGAAPVWAVEGMNNNHSRTRSYQQKFYCLDDGLEYEVEVRIKL
ncbi:MAG: hypothetical protein MJ071_02085 [Oscillospiraceae bacterium]|nr:hypothetical protein [Oscillospiraceae bacterium]